MQVLSWQHEEDYGRLVSFGSGEVIVTSFTLQPGPDAALNGTLICGAKDCYNVLRDLVNALKLDTRGRRSGEVTRLMFLADSTLDLIKKTAELQNIRHGVEVRLQAEETPETSESPLAHPDYPDDQWTNDDQEAACAEGWAIWEYQSDSRGCGLEIERNDANDPPHENAPTWDSDDAAISHVTAQAQAGSALHQRALAIHTKYNKQLPGYVYKIKFVIRSLIDPSIRGVGVDGTKVVAEGEIDFRHVSDDQEEVKAAAARYIEDTDRRVDLGIQVGITSCEDITRKEPAEKKAD